MILHIFNNQKKFSVKFFEYLKDYGIDFSKHKLFHYGPKVDYYKTIPEMEVKFCKSFFSVIPHFWMYEKMKKADKIFIHSLASPVLLLLLLLNSDMAKKSYWLIWGKDLYFYKSVGKYNLLYKAYELLRKPVIKKIGHIVTSIDGDYDLAVKWYGATGIREDVTRMGYAYSVDIETGNKKNIEQNADYLRIMLGNSASKTNCHMEAFERLKKLDDGTFEIYSPLSYGGKKSYVKKVVKRGKELFGNRFFPILEFMEYQKYMDMLNSMDIGFFYHDRQEAMDSVVSLIAKGKTVYIRSDVTPWNHFKKSGIVLKDSLSKEVVLETLPEEVLINNRNNLTGIHDADLAFKQWEKMFS